MIWILVNPNVVIAQYNLYAFACDRHFKNRFASHRSSGGNVDFSLCAVSAHDTAFRGHTSSFSRPRKQPIKWSAIRKRVSQPARPNRATHHSGVDPFSRWPSHIRYTGWSCAMCMAYPHLDAEAYRVFAVGWFVAIAASLFNAFWIYNTNQHHSPCYGWRTNSFCAEDWCQTTEYCFCDAVALCTSKWCPLPWATPNSIEIHLRAHHQTTESNSGWIYGWRGRHWCAYRFRFDQMPFNSP